MQKSFCPTLQNKVQQSCDFMRVGYAPKSAPAGSKANDVYNLFLID
jgi:hypothetical protein